MMPRLDATCPILSCLDGENEVTLLKTNHAAQPPKIAIDARPHGQWTVGFVFELAYVSVGGA